MSALRSCIAIAVIVPVILLTACQPEPAPAPSPSTTEAATPSSSPSPAAMQLPADAVLGMTGTVTADNGAQLSLTLIVHSSKPPSDPAGAVRAKAITDWCVDEMDAGVLTSGSYGLVQVDYTATLVGSMAWPTNLPIELLPTPEGVGLASSGIAKQIEILQQPAQPGDYVPHCQQPAFLNGPGSGSTYVALAGDASDTPPFTRWADFHYGFDGENPLTPAAAVPPGGTAPILATFADCTATVTALGSSLGYPSATWAQEFKEAHCLVGGATP